MVVRWPDVRISLSSRCGVQVEAGLGSGVSGQHSIRWFMLGLIVANR
jgi:hypothetical protein